jgi:hypothetical protein
MYQQMQQFPLTWIGSGVPTLTFCYWYENIIPFVHRNKLYVMQSNEHFVSILVLNPAES